MFVNCHCFDIGRLHRYPSSPQTWNCQLITQIIRFSLIECLHSTKLKHWLLVIWYSNFMLNWSNQNIGMPIDIGQWQYFYMKLIGTANKTVGGLFHFVFEELYRLIVAVVDDIFYTNHSIKSCSIYANSCASRANHVEHDTFVCFSFIENLQGFIYTDWSNVQYNMKNAVDNFLALQSIELSTRSKCAQEVL